MKLPFTQVDAFANHPFEGNPAAVIPLANWLPDETLQAIAAENNLSETAFILETPRPADADYELRWFTPNTEVALCGHATLASGHVILSREPALARVRFQTRQAGILEVARAPQGYRMALPAWAPAPSDDRRIADALGGHGLETFLHPQDYAVVLYSSEAEIRALQPDFARLGALGNTLAIATAPGETADIVSRVFAAGAGIDEDPVTGSAHAVIVPLWAQRLGRTRFTAYQASARGGHMVCEIAGDRVYLEANCVTVIEGSFHLRH
jgi:PhzF family phenazine biosynthesis protein